MRLIGIDPGLRNTGWGVLDADGNRLRHVAAGTIRPGVHEDTASRLRALHDGLAAVLAEYGPDEAAVEETFVNANPESTLKLGQARGVALLAPALLGIPVFEYAPNRVKKAVVGAGHAAKTQVQFMVARLLPGCAPPSADAADALAVAICHASYCAGRMRAPGDELAAGGRR